MTAGDEGQWRAALGRNADHYLRHFARVAARNSKWVPGWNSAAFLHSTGWFCYRRMYGWAFLNLFAPWILFFALVFGGNWIAPGANLDALALAMLVAYFACVFILVPLFADSLYYRHLQARVSGARPPSAWTALGAAAFVVAYGALVLAMAVPAYGDYGVPRAKVSDAVLAASSLRTGVTEFHAEHQRFPDAAEGRQIVGEPQSAYVQSIVWDPAQRAIIVTMREPFPGKRFALRAAEENGQLAWKCGTIDLDKKHLPLACRD